MGFIKETYTNGSAGLVVSFAQKETTENFFAGDSIEEAMKHFKLFIDENNRLRIDSESERAMDALEIKPEEAKDFRSKVDTLLVALTDEQAIENIILFPTWSIGINYKVNDRIRYGGILYRVLQDHTSQEDWNPSAAASLFARVLNETEDGSVPEWVQPEATEGYMIGDHVMYEGVEYESLIDNNVWSPADYPAGWATVVETETE